VTPLSAVIRNACAISMKSISKELPWPGSRCGWIEVYNAKKDSTFAQYMKSIEDSKMLEVCSTSLPQRVIPKIFTDARYRMHVEQRNNKYERRAKIAYDLLKDVTGIVVNMTNGAFYMTVMFEEGVLNHKQSLPVQNKAIKDLVDEIAIDVALDKRFVYYLLATTGICVVPLTGFNCTLQGFRITLLEDSDIKFEQIFKTVKDKIIEYLKSA